MVGPGLGRSDCDGARQGRLLLDARRQALPRFQQPADVRQRRTRRRTHHRGDPGTGRDDGVRQPVHGDRGARRGLARSSRELAPGDIDVFFFTNGGADANENAIKMARAYHRPPQDPRALSLVSRRHARRNGADRRSAAMEHRTGNSRRRSRARPLSRRRRAAGTPPPTSLAMLEEIIQLEGPHTIAAFFLETVSGTNGVLIPPTAISKACASCARSTAS